MREINYRLHSLRSSSGAMNFLCPGCGASLTWGNSSYHYKSGKLGIPVVDRESISGRLVRAHCPTEGCDWMFWKSYQRR